MKKSVFAVILGLIAASAVAKDIKIERFRYAGPYEMRAPLMLDSVSLDSQPFKVENLLETPLKLGLVKSAKVVSDTVFSHSGTPSLHLLGFQVQNSAFAKAKISVKGLKNYHLYIDGSKASGGETQLQPGTHEIVVKYLTIEAGSDTVRVNLTSDADLTADATTGKRLLTINDLYDGLRIGGVSLSPDGRYAITSYTETLSTGRSSTRYRVTDTKTGTIVGESDKAISWMPRSNRYYYTQPGEGGRRIVTVEPATGLVSTLATGLSEDGFVIAPNEKFLMSEGRQGRASIRRTRRPPTRLEKSNQFALL